MNLSLKRAFAATTLTFAAGVTAISPALADDIIHAPDPAASTQLANNVSAMSFNDIMAQASDATTETVDYNRWFIDQILRGVESLYVEDVTLAELEVLAEEGARQLAANGGSFTMDQFVEAVLDNVLNTLDPHSDYMNAEQWAEVMERTSGSFVGIGVRIEMDASRGLLKVVEPIPGSPATQAGMQEGDIITHIDGQSMQGKTIDENIELMRGQVGSSVDVTVERPGETAPITVQITRDVIQANSPVIFRAVDDIAYIRITQFNALTTQKLHEAVEELQRSMGEGNIRGYVLDLRYNPGGLLNEAISVVDSFIDSGGIVATGDASGTNLNFQQARIGDITNGAPIAVLVNGASASASEIVAGALQDNGRATIVGTQTFGKGSVQSVLALGRFFRGREDGMKITTALYYTPSGDTIQNHGVTPDIRTEFQGTVSDGRIGTSEAALTGVIANPELVTDLSETHSTCDASDVAPDMSALADEVTLQLRDGTTEPDYQLLCAIDHLGGNSDFTDIEPLETLPVQQVIPAP